MKTLFSFLLIFFGFTHLEAQKIDSSVVKIFESNFKVITRYLDKTDTSLKKISDAIYFFTDLTGIASESSGTYYGQFRPTKNDLKAWTSWYHLNNDYLMWDKEIKVIILYKKVKPVIL